MSVFADVHRISLGRIVNILSRRVKTARARMASVRWAVSACSLHLLESLFVTGSFESHSFAPFEKSANVIGAVRG